jgi:hypothetical protein
MDRENAKAGDEGAWEALKALTGSKSAAVEFLVAIAGLVCEDGGREGPALLGFRTGEAEWDVGLVGTPTAGFLVALFAFVGKAGDSVGGIDGRNALLALDGKLGDKVRRGDDRVGKKLEVAKVGALVLMVGKSGAGDKVGALFPFDLGPFPLPVPFPFPFPTTRVEMSDATVSLIRIHKRSYLPFFGPGPGPGPLPFFVEPFPFPGPINELTSD